MCEKKVALKVISLTGRRRRRKKSWMLGKGYEHTIWFKDKDKSAFGVPGVAELAAIELRCRHGVCATTPACAMMDARCQRGEDSGR